MKVITYLKKNIIYLLLVLIGLLQIIGAVTKFPAIYAIGFIYNSSPLPVVFTSVSGYEPFAMHIIIDYKTKSGNTGSVQVTNKNYEAMPGPTVMRDCYQVVFAYAPILPEKMSNSVLSYAFFTNGSVAKALGINDSLKDVVLRLEANKDGKDMEWKREIRLK
jgi:hypothetical protein